MAEGALLRRGRERAPVDALDEALGGELLQVAADRVLRDAELLDQARGDDLAVARERVEDRLAAFGAEERCRFMHVCAWYCMNMPTAQVTIRITATIVPPAITIRRSQASGSLRP